LVNIGIFWSIGIGWIEKCSISIGKYWYNLVVSVLVSVNIGIFWSIGIGWIEKYSISIGKNNTDPPSLLYSYSILQFCFHMKNSVSKFIKKIGRRYPARGVFYIFSSI